MPSLLRPFPIQFIIGGLSLTTVHVRVKLSPAVGLSVEATMLTSFVNVAE